MKGNLIEREMRERKTEDMPYGVYRKWNPAVLHCGCRMCRCEFGKPWEKPHKSWKKQRQKDFARFYLENVERDDPKGGRVFKNCRKCGKKIRKYEGLCHSCSLKEDKRDKPFPWNY